MVDETKLTYEELQQKLAEAEKLIAGLKGNGSGVTPREQTFVEACKESEQNFRNSMDACPLGIRVMTSEGNLFYANQAILDITGYRTLEELNAVPGEQLYTPESYTAHLQRKEKRKRGEYVPPEYEIGIRRPDGEIRTLQVLQKEIIWGGQPQYMAMYVDITERLKVEETLKNRDGFLDNVIENTPSPLWVSDENGTVIRMNQALRDLLKLTDKEVVGKYNVLKDSQVIAQGFLPLVKSVYEQGKTASFTLLYQTTKEIQINPARDTGVILEIIMSPVKNQQGKVTNVVCQEMDISRRVRVEQELIIQRDFSRSVFDTAQTIMLVIDPDGRIVVFNPYLEEIAGYKLEEVSGKYWYDVFVPERDRARTKENLRQTMNVISIQGNIGIIVTKDGREREIEWYIKTLKDTSGRVSGLLAVGHDVTERRKMEAGMRYHASLIRNISDAIVSSDADKKILSWNKAAEEMYGWREAEVIGKSVMEITNPVFPNIPKGDILASLQKNGHWKGEGIHQRRNGEKFDVLISISLMRDDTGKEIGAVTTFKDITDRMQAEEKYQAVVKTTLDGFVIADLKGKILDVNDSFCQMIGYSRAEMLNMSIPDFEDIDTSEEITRRIKDVASTGYGRFETRHRHRDGHLIYVEVSVKYQEGKEGQLFVFIHDITARKQSEERINHLNLALRSIRNINQLITREKKRDRLIQGICDNLVSSRSFHSAWIILLDNARQPVTWAGTNVKGLPGLVGVLKKGELPRCVEKALKQKKIIVTKDPKENCLGCPVLGETEGIGTMTTILEFDDTLYGILCGSMWSSVLIDDEEISLFSEVAADITFALRDIDLGSRNELLQQEQLRAAKLESIGTLAGGIAHDFNNLLTGIMGNIGLAKTLLPPSGNVFEILDEAEKAAARSRDLTQQLLTFARGGKPIKKVINIIGLIKESAAFALHGSKVKLELSLPDNLWLVEADEGQIGQVIHNLVINAGEAMPHGGTLIISARNLNIRRAGALPLSGGNYVEIDVSDTGLGIAPEHLSRIFEPYFTTKHKGSGLGLTSAYSIIKGHGGALLAESVLNKGSVFHIYLPASRKTARGEKKVADKKSTQAGGKVLIMDDDEIIRKMLKNMLNLAGYEVEASADGEEALAKYKEAIDAQNPFSAVIMDLTIPGGMGGKEAITKLLEIDPEASVIVSSGYATDAIMSEYKKYGFSAVIAKPYSIKQLQETITSLNPKKK
jgi:two-component system cell cycle sensor histidine kinase/response regulator CckA